MNKKIYRVECSDGKLYLVHHGVSDYMGLEGQGTNEKAIIQISHYLNELEDKLKRIEKEVYTCNIYHDNLKNIILEIRCILNGDVDD